MGIPLFRTAEVVRNDDEHVARGLLGATIHGIDDRAVAVDQQTYRETLGHSTIAGNIVIVLVDTEDVLIFVTATELGGPLMNRALGHAKAITRRMNQAGADHRPRRPL